MYHLKDSLYLVYVNHVFCFVVEILVLGSSIYPKNVSGLHGFDLTGSISYKYPMTGKLIQLLSH